MATGIQWRDTGLRPRFFIVDAYILPPILALMFHPSAVTVAILFLTATFFYLIERKGYDLPVTLRSIRSLVIGKSRPAFNWRQQAKFH